MSEQTDTEKAEKKHMGGEMVIPVSAVLFTLYYFITIIDVPWTAQVAAFFVGTILLLLIGLFFYRTVKEVRRGEADLAMGGLFEPKSFIPKCLALLGLTLGFIVFVEWLGFTITVFLFMSGAMLMLNEGRRKGLILGISAVLALGGWALFIWAFDTRFPAGPFELMMQSVL